MHIVYRMLRPADASSYRSVRLDCLRRFPGHFGSSYDEELATPKLKFEAIIEKGSGDEFMLGALLGERLIAIAGLTRDGRRKARHCGEIVQMYVDPAHRGQKVGETLLRRVIESAFRMEGIEHLDLGVVTDNAAATKLYESVGFETCGVKRRHFKDGDGYRDQRLMQLFKDRYR